MSFIAWLIIVLGALNWGFVGLWNINPVAELLGAWPLLVRIIYILVGLAGIWCLVDRIRRLVS